jgi:hypothetical protein
MHAQRKRSVVVLAAVGAATGVLAGGIVGANLPPGGKSVDELHRVLAKAPMEYVADVPSGGGLPRRAIFLQRADGYVCLWDAPSAGSLTRQGGCNPESDPLGGAEMFVSLSFDGGPTTRDISDARIVGLASRRVVRVAIEMSDGSRRVVSLTRARGGFRDLAVFGFRARGSDLRLGTVPTAVVALDADGRELQRQATGLSG